MSVGFPACVSPRAARKRTLASAKEQLGEDESRRIHVRAAGPEADELVAAHWRAMWLDAGMAESSLLPDLEARTVAFIREARESLGYQTLLAVDDEGEVVGSAACQTWAGPIPAVVRPAAFKLGTVWAVYVRPAKRRHGAATELMRAVKAHLRSIGCKRVVLLHATDAGRRVYERVGFRAGELLLADLPAAPAEPRAAAGSVVVEAAGADADATVVEHWRRMWLEAGVPASEFEADFEEITLRFIARARTSLQYQTFVARDTQTGGIVGSVSCQVWEGPLPLVLEETAFKLGTCWAVYVAPDARRRGVASLLMTHCMRYWRSIGCQRGVLIHASDAGRRCYQKLGFRPANGMVADLTADEDIAVPTPSAFREEEPRQPKQRAVAAAAAAAEPGVAAAAQRADTVDAMLADLRDAGAEGEDRALRLLLRALPQQLAALRAGNPPQGDLHLLNKVAAVQRAHNVFIDEADNWLTRNVARLGEGFDMQKLAAEPGRLARKFDRLAERYDEWTVGNRSKVEGWLTQQARRHADRLGGPDRQLLDLACGVGLPGHQLRLCGFAGHLVGLDISPGMVERTRERGAHDAVHVADANGGLGLLETASLDLVICTGALELLDHAIVLPEVARVLKPGGHFWASFQHEAPDMDDHPTAHQNVRGVSRADMDRKLRDAGLLVCDVEQCDDAFYTPRNGVLVPVPYLFVAAVRPPRGAERA